MGLRRFLVRPLLDQRHQVAHDAVHVEVLRRIDGGHTQLLQHVDVVLRDDAAGDDGARADLRDGFWEIRDAWVVRIGREPEKFDTYLLSTYLTPERVTDALGSLLSVSFWELPTLIEVAEKAKLSSGRLRIQYEALISRPLLCAAMVLLAATVSLRSFRQGGIQTMVVTGMIGGFGFFLLAEISRQLGAAGLAVFKNLLL